MTLTERIKRDTKKAIQDYNTDKISFQTAISRVHALGWAPLDAWALVEGTHPNPPDYLKKDKSDV